MVNKVDIRVLLVDDEPEITTVLTKGLQQFGFEIRAFNSPTQALSNYKAGSYDLVLLDIRMPQMSGFELYRKLKDVDPEAKISITAFDIYEEEFKKMFPSYDVKWFIRKPVKVRELADRIKGILTEPNLAQ